jgi:DNA-binding NtrC family response regulator
MKRGAFDYMTKPVDLMKLETTIQHAIINHKNDGTLKHKEVVS